MHSALMSTYARLPIALTHGEGARLWDSEGKSYLDAVSGVGVCGLGHAHPAVSEAVAEQARRLVHTSNLYDIPLQTTLAESLIRHSGQARAFFCNSGAEAIEAAIKIARLHGHRQGITEPSILVASGSFHGRTLAALTATGNSKIQAGFAPLVPGFVRVPYNDPQALARAGENDPNVVAVLLEPVQGEGGVVVPDADFLPRVRRLCDTHNWLMILDEVQTGLGRTGEWFAWQHSAASPDVMTLAKSLGNGIPIGTCLARGDAAEYFRPGSHGSTFGGNPLACRAALAVLQVIEQEGLVEKARLRGEQLRMALETSLQGFDVVSTVRGMGLMIGIVLRRPCTGLVREAMARGLLINVTAENVIRLLPPLILSSDEADRIVATVTELIRDLPPEVS